MNITIQRIKRKQILFSLCSFAMLWGLSINLNAQVAIGLTEKPVDGALLQLKDIEGVTDGAQNANKGMNMPRVELTALNTLIISGEDYNSEALKHVGLIVFNMKEDQSKNLYKAPYLWDGERWGLIYDKDWVDAPRSLYFYKNAWMPKELPVTGFVDNIDRNVNIDIQPDARGTVDFSAGGAVFPILSHIQPDGEEEYTFKPAENTSGEIRSTDVTFTASRSGTIGTASKTTRVVHYPYEFPIHVNPAVLPATLINNGIGAVSIWSVADWKISLSQPADHDTQSMLATNLTPGDELRDETPLKLNINQNSTWDEKEIKINVESVGIDGKHYEDLVPQTLTVKQKANLPSIVISDPANKILDFGLQTTGSKNVRISSNARWTATGDPNIAEVIGNNAILGGTQHGANSPAVPISTTIALPVSTTGGNAKAGTVYSSNITFTTAGHETAAPSSTTLAVKKTIPIRWDNPTITPVSNPLPRTVAYFTANVSTNTDWSRGADPAAVNGNQPKMVTGYTANDSQTIAIHNNDSWYPRNIYAALWHASSTQTGITVQQLGYDLYLPPAWGTNLAGGATIGASANSSYYAHLLTNRGAPVGIIGVSTVADASSWLWLGDAPHSQNVVFDIPRNTGGERALHFFYEKSGYKWELIGTMYQAAPVFEVNITSEGIRYGVITVKSDVPFMYCLGSLSWGTTVTGGGFDKTAINSGATFHPTTTTTYTFRIERDYDLAAEWVYVHPRFTPQGGASQLHTLKLRRSTGNEHTGVEYRGTDPNNCSY